MGRKRSRAGEYLCLCVAGLIVALLAGCAPLRAILTEREERAHLQRVRLLTRQGDFTGALQENRRVLALSPKSPPGDAALFTMGLIYADYTNPEKDYKKALEFFTQLVNDFPQSRFSDDGRVWVGILENEMAGYEGRAHLQRMWLLTRQGDFEGALRENRKVLDLSPKSPPGDAALFSMGQIYADHTNPKMDYKQALDFFTQLLKDFPQSRLAEGARVWAGTLGNDMVGKEGRAHLQRVRLLIRQGNFDAALRENRKVLALYPKSPPGDAALYSMGQIYADYANPEKDHKKALGFFTQLLKEFPDSPLAEGARLWAGTLGSEMVGYEGRAHLQRVQTLIHKGDFEGALRENQKVLALSPKSPPGDAALFSMGLIHVHFANPKLDYKKAFTFFTRLKKEFPNSPFVEEAKIWIGVLETVEKALQIDIRIDEQKKELRR